MLHDEYPLTRLSNHLGVIPFELVCIIRNHDITDWLPWQPVENLDLTIPVICYINCDIVMSARIHVRCKDCNLTPSNSQFLTYLTPYL